MYFHPQRLPGVWALDLDRRKDDRGYFARVWCQREMQAHGLPTAIAQINTCHNVRRATLRGMHFQLPPHAEGKFVSCTQGAIYDVALDLRRESPTYLQWVAEELTAENRRALFIPEGCAHGFQTLTTDATVLYFMTESYAPESGRGVRFDDPAFGIEWPLPVSCITATDRNWPDYQLQCTAPHPAL